MNARAVQENGGAVATLRNSFPMLKDPLIRESHIKERFGFATGHIAFEIESAFRTARCDQVEKIRLISLHVIGCGWLCTAVGVGVKTPDELPSAATQPPHQIELR